MYFFDQLFQGISLGALYALIAIGFSMVYGVLRLLNFAHSELITSGAYASYLLSCYLFEGKNLLLTDVLILLVFSAFISGLLAILFFYVGYKSIYRKSRIAVLISAIGISVFIQSVIIFCFGGKSYATLHSNVDYSVFSIIVIVVIAIFLFWFLKNTQLGIWMRAVSDDYDTAKLMGIKPNKIIVLVFFIGGALAGVAGTIISLQDGSLNPSMGYLYGLKAFAISVVGGIGNIGGAIFIGVLLGISEVLFQAFLPEGINHFTNALIFVLLLAVLLYKPNGLFTKYL